MYDSLSSTTYRSGLVRERGEADMDEDRASRGRVGWDDRVDEFVPDLFRLSG